MIFTAIVGVFCTTMIAGGLWYIGRKRTDETGISNSTIGEARWNSHSSVVELEVDKVFDLSGRSELFEIMVVVMIVLCLCGAQQLSSCVRRG